MIKTDVLVIGAGPIGLFAVHQLGIIGLKAEVVDNLDKVGGQCIELYPDKPIYDIPATPECTGESLTKSLLEQIKPFKTNFHLNERVQAVSKEKENWKITTSKNKIFIAPNIIVAGGVGSFEPRKFSIEGIEKFENNGVFYSVKDKNYFKNKKICIFGGGDSALDWANELSKISEVILIHRRNEFRGAEHSGEIARKLEKEGKLKIKTPFQINSVEGDSNISAITVKSEDGKIEKGEFYFADIKPKVINILQELQLIIPDTIQSYTWKKSMKWSVYDLSWGRPLKSIIALFNDKVINFNFFHLESNNFTFVDGAKEEEQKKVNNFKSYLNILKSQNIVLDQEKRKEIILKKFNNICISKKLKNNFNEKLIEEVVNLVENPNVIVGKFDEIYLKIPNEILIITMQQHQKYFPLFERDNKLTNLFLFVSNLPDKKGYIKIGNQRVIEARLSDAKFFWDKNKNQNLVKQVSKLKNLSFFKDLGSFYDRTQRLRKLASLISDQLNLSKEKVEIASSICKADLTSDLVGEYPELQGVMGKYFALAQGFEDDISLAISDHYLPIGANTELPKKPLGLAVALIDKIDVLVGFFGINEKPTSSKDPFALRRMAIGLLRIITEKKLSIRLKDLINYSIVIYEDQNVNFSNKFVTKDVLFFLRERFKNLLKDKKIRNDIIEAVDSSHSSDNFLELYRKCLIINKNISKDIYKNIISTYKRASNIIDHELRHQKDKIIGQPESYLFKKEEEKNLFDKINNIRKYFSSVKTDESYDETLRILAEAKSTTDNFFDNVIVNDDNSDIKKNRLELLQMFCKTYNNFIDFSKVEGI